VHCFQTSLMGVVLQIVCASAVAVPAQAADAEITPHDYALYIDWKDGREDPRLQDLSDAVKLKKIARSLGLKARDLKVIIDRVAPVAPRLRGENEKAIRAALGQTPLKSQLVSVEVNTDIGNVIAWVKWKCGDPRDVDKEAAYVAWATAQGGSVVKTLGLWCVNQIDTKLFSGKIGRDAFLRIRKEAIERFAASRYIRLFEEVKRGPHR